MLLSKNWADKESLAIILVARRSPNSGRIAVASYLVDLTCLGVKDSQTEMAKDEYAYRSGLYGLLREHYQMQPTSLDLVAKIIPLGVEFAAKYGFKPHPVFQQSIHLLHGAWPQNDPTEVPVGDEEGKPLFIAGPYDDAPRIIAQLERTAGEGNFKYVIPGLS